MKNYLKHGKNNFLSNKGKAKNKLKVFHLNDKRTKFNPHDIQFDKVDNTFQSNAGQDSLYMSLNEDTEEPSTNIN